MSIGKEEDDYIISDFPYLGNNLRDILLKVLLIKCSFPCYPINCIGSRIRSILEEQSSLFLHTSSQSNHSINIPMTTTTNSISIPSTSNNNNNNSIEDNKVIINNNTIMIEDIICKIMPKLKSLNLNQLQNSSSLFSFPFNNKQSVRFIFFKYLNLSTF